MKGVVVIGGGIAGVQAALDLAESGIKTYLVERSPSLGGNMAKLDKTFPTNDCAMCILSPKLVSTARHEQIELLTNSEVVGLKGAKGNFRVRVKKYPGFVETNKCNACGKCEEVCPIEAASPFEMNLGVRKAIYIPFPQAVPMAYTIDPDICIGCGLCQQVCPSKAINFYQRESHVELEAASIIVATGYESINPGVRIELGYGRYANVITNMELERLMSASGPTRGRIIKPSDGEIPRSIVFIQCVGSRDQRACKYCSGICCMNSIKQAITAIEHEPLIRHVSILYLDIRAQGKGHEDYFNRAGSEFGIDFIRGGAAEIVEKSNKGLIARIEDTLKGELRELEADLIVLSPALKPSRYSRELARALNVELDEYGFFKEGKLTIESTREGIFLAGCATGPRDISNSVALASAAAARAATLARDFVIEKKPRAMPFNEAGEPRTGVLICKCGINISSTVDVSRVVEYARSLKGVVHAEEGLYACSEDAQKRILEMIEQHNLNRLVVASCTPRTHEPIFRETIREAGLNPYLLEFINIREQCSWVHSREPEMATQKACDLVRMGIKRAAKLEPLKVGQIEVRSETVVIGGGIAGIQAAIDISGRGFKTTIIEKTPFLGGMVARLNKISPLNIDPGELLAEKYALLEKNGVTLYTSSSASSAEGVIGNFQLKLSRKPRGVIINKCNLCGKCAEACPVNVSEGRKAIYYLNNSIPRAYAVDWQFCNRCSKCAAACPNGAIELTADVREEALTAGTVVIAIGSGLYTPAAGEYGYGKLAKVITNFELEQILCSSDRIAIGGKMLASAAFILCVGSRVKNGNSWCSRYCCSNAIKQAIALRERGISVIVLYKDIRTFSKGAEEVYQLANRKGVTFIKYSDENPPAVTPHGINIFDSLSGKELSLETDAIVLSLGLEPAAEEFAALEKLFKVPRGRDGFLMEKHPKLAPVDTNVDGIFICGCVQGPNDIADSLAQASAAAASAAIPMSKRKIELEPLSSYVVEDKCIGCGLCVKLCPYSVPEIESGKSKISEVLCRGCGTCTASCPRCAIVSRHYTDEQIIAQIGALIPH